MTSRSRWAYPGSSWAGNVAVRGDTVCASAGSSAHTAISPNPFAHASRTGSRNLDGCTLGLPGYARAALTIKRRRARVTATYASRVSSARFRGRQASWNALNSLSRGRLLDGNSRSSGATEVCNNEKGTAVALRGHVPSDCSDGKLPSTQHGSAITSRCSPFAAWIVMMLTASGRSGYCMVADRFRLSPSANHCRNAVIPCDWSRDMKSLASSMNCSIAARRPRSTARSLAASSTSRPICRMITRNNSPTGSPA